MEPPYTAATNVLPSADDATERQLPTPALDDLDQVTPASVDTQMYPP
jgi:hypothetical protein